MSKKWGCRFATGRRFVTADFSVRKNRRGIGSRRLWSAAKFLRVISFTSCSVIEYF
jgi:hypothetical protein